MRPLTDDELRQRFRDIYLNLVIITKATKLGLLPMNAEGMRWMELWTHVLDEFRFRFGPPPAGFHSLDMKTLPVPLPEHPLAKPASRAAAAHATAGDNVLVKYGQREHIRELFDAGRVRVAPASFYSDPSLNSAIQDDELSISALFQSSRGRIVEIEQVSEDYYVFCLAEALEPRLFLDFDGADACLIISDRKGFLDRLRSATRESMEGLRYAAGAATYVDPLNSAPQELDVPFAKHFRYSYQREFRVVWYPESTMSGLEPVFVELGPLSDLAEIIELAQE